MQLPGSWFWPVHHLSRWKNKVPHSQMRNTNFRVDVSKMWAEFYKARQWGNLGMIPSFPIKFLCCYCSKVSHYRNFTKCTDFPLAWFILVNTEAARAYSNVTADYYNTMVAHGLLSMTHAKWPKYWLGFRAPRIPLLLNTEYFNICHKNCADPLLSFLLEEYKPKKFCFRFSQTSPNQYQHLRETSQWASGT